MRLPARVSTAAAATAPAPTPTPVSAATVAAVATAAHRAALVRIYRHALLPHTQRKWCVVAGALKSRGLYTRMQAVPRGQHEPLQAYTRRFAALVQSERGRGGTLLVNVESALYDNVQWNLVEALALPDLCATVILPLTGRCRVVGTPEGVRVVGDALRAAGVSFMAQVP